MVWRRSDALQCEKHGKKEEALEKLKNGGKFDDVAREFSEDKARVGKLSCNLVRGMLAEGLKVECWDGRRGEI